MNRELTLAERCAEVGLPMAALARMSKVRYWRIQLGYPLMADEQRAVDAVLDRYAFRRSNHRNAAAV